MRVYVQTTEEVMVGIVSDTGNLRIGHLDFYGEFYYKISHEKVETLFQRCLGRPN